MAGDPRSKRVAVFVVLIQALAARVRVPHAGHEIQQKNDVA